MTRSAPRGRPRLQRIELRDCSVRFGRHWALREVSFDLRAGERWLLTGHNGAGKTVLLKLLRGHVWPTPTGRELRRYHLRGGEIELQPIAASEHVAYLGPERQDRYERHESTLTVAEVVLTGFDDSELPLRPATRAQRARIAAALEGVGLRGLAGRRLLTLSYGQRRRVLLARALVRGPDVLLLDEALNGLDAQSRRNFLGALHRTVPAHVAWVLTSHRAADAAEAQCERIARIVAGRLVAEPALPEARARDRTADGSSRRRAANVPPGRVLLQLGRAAVYREGRPVIAPFDWVLEEGARWRVRGPNGAGKSSLIALLYGDLWPRHGATHVRRWPAVDEWKRRVGLVSPELQARYAAAGSTLEEIVISGLHDSIGLAQPPSAPERRRARASLRAWGLEALGARRSRELSYGQLRLALVARAFVRTRRLYLLDEPFDGLDAEARALLQSKLAEVAARGAAIVLATHHDEDVPDCVDRELVLRRGRAPVQKPPLAPPPPNLPPPPA
jgi:molybdate transport system ATP-binding protein